MLCYDQTRIYINNIYHNASSLEIDLYLVYTRMHACMDILGL